MSRCRACNEILDSVEERRTYAGSKQPLELCDVCLDPVRDDIDISGGDDLVDVGYEFDDESYEPTWDD